MYPIRDYDSNEHITSYSMNLVFTNLLRGAWLLVKEEITGDEHESTNRI